MSGRSLASAAGRQKPVVEPPEALVRRGTNANPYVASAGRHCNNSKERAGSKERAASRERGGNLTPERSRNGQHADHAKSPVSKSPSPEPGAGLPPVRGSTLAQLAEVSGNATVNSPSKKHASSSRDVRATTSSAVRQKGSFGKGAAAATRQVSKVGGSHDRLPDALELSTPTSSDNDRGGEREESWSSHVTEWHRSNVRKAARIKMFADASTFMVSEDSGGERGPASLQCTVPLSHCCYFEVAILSMESGGTVCVGAASKSAGLKTRLGSSGGLHKSFGYLSRDGALFVGVATEDSKTMAYSAADIVGCGYTEGKGELYFTKNGRVVKALSGLQRSPGELVPTITLEGVGTVVRINYSGNFEFTVPASSPGKGLGRGAIAATGGGGALEVVGFKSSPGGRSPLAKPRQRREDELGRFLRCSATAKKHVKLHKDQVTFWRQPYMNSYLSDHTLVFGTVVVPTHELADAAGVGSGLLGDGHVYYFEVAIGSSAPVDEAYREVGAFHGADVYIGFAETSLAGLPGIEDYR